MWRDGEGKREQGRNHPFWAFGSSKRGLGADLAETSPPTATYGQFRPGRFRNS
jgi:hypothetical protein